MTQANTNTAKMHYAVIGANGGVGSAIAAKLNSFGKVTRIDGPESKEGYDFSDIVDIHQATDQIMSESSEETYPVLVNCVGVNYIDWFENMDLANQWDRLMNLNVRSHLQLVQCLLEAEFFTGSEGSSVAESGTICEIISNASHMPMTNSAIYNASKGAQHMATMSLARELRKSHSICVFGVSPNKLRGTGMSSYIEGKVTGLRGWTPEEAHQYQLAALPAGEETPPDTFAEFVAWTLSRVERHRFLTNTVLPYGA